jgi:hypothetical protein
MKMCIKCRESKPLTAFGKSTMRKSGLETTCRACINAKQHEFRRLNPALIKIKQTQVYAKKVGGLPITDSLDSLNLFLKNHSGICDIISCRAKAINLDHCHKTGKVRGMLCNRHNMGLGMFEDSTEELVNAVFYLEHHR